MTKLVSVKLTGSFERHLESIEQFLEEAGASSAFDVLLHDLLTTVIPNLERYPGMGRSFFRRSPQSVESINALARLEAQLLAMNADQEALREYVMAHHLVLYVWIGKTLYLLAIRHHRQLSFDVESLWLEE